MITKSYNIRYTRNNKDECYCNIHAPTIDDALVKFRNEAEDKNIIFEILHIRFDGIDPISENDIKIFGEPKE